MPERHARKTNRGTSKRSSHAQQVENASSSFRSTGQSGVDILSIATAVPENRISQNRRLTSGRDVSSSTQPSRGLYTNTGIEQRYSCLPTIGIVNVTVGRKGPRPFNVMPSPCSRQWRSNASAKAGLELADIDMMVTNTITGPRHPKPRLHADEPASRSRRRSSACRFSGLAAAAESRVSRAPLGWPARSRAPTSCSTTVDLCSLCMRPNDQSLAMFVSAALFGDGAAGVVLRASRLRRQRHCRSTGDPDFLQSTSGHKRRTSWVGTSRRTASDVVLKAPSCLSSCETSWGPRSRHLLVVRNNLEAFKTFDGFLLHPGGRKILETAEEARGQQG